MHDPAHIPPAQIPRPAGWQGLSEALLRAALIVLLVGVTVLAGAASQSRWSVQDVRWLRGVTVHIGAADAAIANARPVPPGIALPPTLRGPELPDGMPMSAAFSSRIYAAVDAADEDATRARN